jgi:hypothetical protein
MHVPTAVDPANSSGTPNLPTMEPPMHLPNTRRHALRPTFPRLVALLAYLAGLAIQPGTASAQSQPPAGYDKLRVTRTLETQVTTGGQITVQLDTQTIEPTIDPGELILYVDHVPLAGTKPVTGGVKRSTLHYRMDRTAANRDAWLVLFRRHGFKPDSVPIGVGLAPFGEIATAAQARVNVRIAVVFGWTLAAGAVIAALIVFFMIVYGGVLLRERPRPSAPPGPLPYSLGRVQMAFWFTLVAGGYVFIALATRDHNGILNSTTLTLIGIGVGTALGSAAIQAQKKENAQRKLAVLRSQLTRDEILREEGDAAAGTRAEQIAAQRNDLVALSGKPPSRDFWKDLIHDDTGPSFHRFQIVIWTLLLGVVFIRYLVWYVAMPVFDETTLALMGISGGTYLGFKIPERQPPTPDPTP